MLATTMSRILMGPNFNGSRELWSGLVTPACYAMVLDLYKEGPVVDIPLALKEQSPTMYYFLTCDSTEYNHHLRPSLANLQDEAERPLLVRGYQTNIPQICFLTCFIWLIAEMDLRKLAGGKSPAELESPFWRFMSFPAESYHFFVKDQNSVKEGPTLNEVVVGRTVDSGKLAPGYGLDPTRIFAPRFRWSTSGARKKRLMEAASHKACRNALLQTENFDHEMAVSVRSFFGKHLQTGRLAERCLFLEDVLSKYNLFKAFADASERGTHLFTDIYLKRHSAKDRVKKTTEMANALLEMFPRELPLVMDPCIYQRARLLSLETNTEKGVKTKEKKGTGKDAGAGATATATATSNGQEDSDAADDTPTAATAGRAKKKPALGVPKSFLLTDPDKKLYNKIKSRVTDTAALTAREKQVAPALALAQLYAEKAAYLLSVAHRKALGEESEDIDTADGIGEAMAGMDYKKGGAHVAWSCWCRSEGNELSHLWHLQCLSGGRRKLHQGGCS
jgi:hypothetical protein